jgi:hypothetical protein
LRDIPEQTFESLMDHFEQKRSSKMKRLVEKTNNRKSKIHHYQSIFAHGDFYP